MLKIMAIMGAGALLGFLVRRWSVLKHLGTTSMATIILLLFLSVTDIGGGVISRAISVVFNAMVNLVF